MHRHAHGISVCADSAVTCISMMHPSVRMSSTKYSRLLDGCDAICRGSTTVVCDGGHTWRELDRQASGCMIHTHPGRFRYDWSEQCWT